MLHLYLKVLKSIDEMLHSKETGKQSKICRRDIIVYWLITSYLNQNISVSTDVFCLDYNAK